MENYQQNENKINVNKEMQDYIFEIAKWGKFLSILGFVGVGFMVLAAIAMMLGGFALSSFTQFPFPMSFFGVFYLLFAVLYFFPCYYLLQSSVGLKKGLHFNDETILTAGFMNLKSVFKFFGISSIVVLVLYGVLIVFGVLAALVFSH